MTINTIKTILNTNTLTETAITELTAELERLEKAQVKRAQESAEKAAMYAEALKVVRKNTEVGVAATAMEIWEACEDKLPDGFTKGNLTYALSRLWVEEFSKNTEGKVNTYSRV